MIRRRCRDCGRALPSRPGDELEPDWSMEGCCVSCFTEAVRRLSEEDSGCQEDESTPRSE
jgi:hypothetical protein